MSMRCQANSSIGRGELPLRLASRRRILETAHKNVEVGPGTLVSNLATVEIPWLQNRYNEGLLFVEQILLLNLGTAYNISPVPHKFEGGLGRCRVKMRVCAVIVTRLIPFYYSLNPLVIRAATATEFR
ncbi:hypothetical protein GGR58DRAFT_497978 [Xylaria digitata]|nr:hypothetical protein GGR58DRAFT_497978 [Xylaria digitata]